MMKTADFSALDLRDKRDRAEIAEAIHRMLGEYSGKILLTFDSMAIQVTVLPRAGEQFRTGGTTYGRIRAYDDYEEE